MIQAIVKTSADYIETILKTKPHTTPELSQFSLLSNNTPRVTTHPEGNKIEYNAVIGENQALHTIELNSENEIASYTFAPNGGTPVTYQGEELANEDTSGTIDMVLELVAESIASSKAID